MSQDDQAHGLFADGQPGLIARNRGCDESPELLVILLLLLFGGVCLCLLVRSGQKRDPTRADLITY